MTKDIKVQSPLPRLAVLRWVWQISIGELAAKVGVSPSQIHRVERGQQPPSRELLQRLIAFFNVESANDIVGPPVTVPRLHRALRPVFEARHIVEGAHNG
jgi:transcriptional regulator with XRE-family HTH domain